MDQNLNFQFSQGNDIPMIDGVIHVGNDFLPVDARPVRGTQVGYHDTIIDNFKRYV
jgi:hypothetical protein